MHILWARSRNRPFLTPRDAVTWSCHTRGRREGGRQEEVAPGRECGWQGRGQAESGPRAGRVEGETSPTKQAQARQASSHGPQTSPRLRRGHASPFLPAPSATPGNPRGQSEGTFLGETQPDTNQGPNGRVLARAQPSTHTSRHTSDNLASSPRGVSPRRSLPSRGCRAQAHILSRALSHSSFVPTE